MESELIMTNESPSNITRLNYIDQSQGSESVIDSTRFYRFGLDGVFNYYVTFEPLLYGFIEGRAPTKMMSIGTKLHHTLEIFWIMSRVSGLQL